MKSGLLLFLLLGSFHLYAEGNCSGTMYPEPTCHAKCTQNKCQDVSFNQDATSFQCCPPSSVAFELPVWARPVGLAALFLLMIYSFKWFQRFRKRSVLQS